MGKNKNDAIPFVALPVGKYVYNYEIGNSFFEEIEYSEIKKGSLIVTLTLNKQSMMLVLHFSLRGTVNVPCDRCNEDFDLELESNHELGIKIGEDGVLDDDVVTISINETELHVAEYIYEYILLSLPIKRVHPNNKKGYPTCNKAAMKIYNKYVKTEEEEIKSIDPRWSELTRLKFNN